MRADEGIIRGSIHLAETFVLEGDVAVARPLLEEALTLARRTERGHLIAYALLALGDLRADEGESEAQALLEEGRGVAETLGDTQQTGAFLSCLGHWSRARGDHATARERYREALAVLPEIGAEGSLEGCFGGLAVLAHAQGAVERAARLLGTADRLRAAAVFALFPRQKALRAETFALVKAALGDRFESAYQAGRALSLPEARALGLESGRRGSDP
jgi:ATP/maltotriose-dependent transcriptional regulator MalT